mmetsp:Transcript_4028/g.13462  ORF Transcript_4028/g.13462 Transcript_4028/m.13462 type:complete len:308 (-) Transcript_4028:440-1363(-)
MRSEGVGGAGRRWRRHGPVREAVHVSSKGVHEPVRVGCSGESEPRRGNRSFRDPRVVLGVVVHAGVRGDLCVHASVVRFTANHENRAVGKNRGSFVADGGWHRRFRDPRRGAAGDVQFVHGVLESSVVRIRGVVVPADGVALSARRGAGHVAARVGQRRRGGPRRRGGADVENLHGLERGVAGGVPADGVDLLADNEGTEIRPTHDEIRAGVVPRVTRGVVDPGGFQLGGAVVHGEAAEDVNLGAHDGGGVTHAAGLRGGLGGCVERVNNRVVLANGSRAGAGGVLAADHEDLVPDRDGEEIARRRR